MCVRAYVCVSYVSKIFVYACVSPVVFVCLACVFVFINVLFHILCLCVWHLFMFVCMYMIGIYVCVYVCIWHLY